MNPRTAHESIDVEHGHRSIQEQFVRMCKCAAIANCVETVEGLSHRAKNLLGLSIMRDACREFRESFSNDLKYGREGRIGWKRDTTVGAEFFSDNRGRQYEHGLLRSLDPLFLAELLRL